MKKTDAIRGSDGQCAEQGMDVTRIGLADSCPPFQDDASHSALVIQNGQLSGDPCGSHPSVNLRNVRWQLNVHFGHKEVLLLFDSDGGGGSSFDAVHLCSLPLLNRIMDHIECRCTALALVQRSLI